MVSDAHYVVFRLAYSYRLHNDQFFSNSIQEFRPSTCYRVESTGDALRSKAANVHSRVSVMRLHPDAVAEHRAASKRTRGIHRQNANGLAFGPRSGSESIDNCALACPGRASNSDNTPAASYCVGKAHDLAEC